MKYALRRPHNSANASRTAGAAGRPPRANAPEIASEPTIGGRLRALHGEQADARWISERLGCPEDVALQLIESWMPEGSPQFVEHSLQTLARHLDLAPAKLLRCLQGPTSAAGAAAAPKAAPRGAPADEPKAPPRKEVTLGSTDGIRVVSQRQPTVVYKKSRRIV